MNLTILLCASGAFAACATYLLLFDDSKEIERHNAKHRIFAESGPLGQKIKICCGGEGVIPVGLKGDVFRAIAKLLEEDAHSTPDIELEFMCQLMPGVGYLELSEAGMSTVCLNLVIAGLGGMHQENIPNANMDRCGRPSISAGTYLGLPRAYAGMCNTSVYVEGGAATLRPKEYCKYRNDKRVSVVRSMRILPPAFGRLLEREEGRMRPASPGATAGPSDGRKVNGWDALAWLLAHMAIDRLDLEGCKIATDHIAPISRLNRPRVLSLRRCGLNQVDLALEYLEELDASDNALNGGGIPKQHRSLSSGPSSSTENNKLCGGLNPWVFS